MTNLDLHKSYVDHLDGADRWRFEAGLVAYLLEYVDEELAAQAMAQVAELVSLVSKPVMCDCQQVEVPVGALSVWCDHIEHSETACIEDQR